MAIGTGTAIAIGGLAAAKMGSDYLSNEAQAEEAAAGREMTAEQVAAANQSAALAGANANLQLDQAVPRIQGSLEDAYLANQDYLGQGYGTARTDILDAGQLGADTLATGRDDALSAVYGGAAQGVDYLSGAQSNVDTALAGGLEGASGLLINRRDRGGEMLDQEGGLYGGFENDPGYQFRLQESEKAINRANAAAGGRHGGAALKELQANAQGLAAQSYNDFVNRRHGEFGAASSNDAQGLQARGQLAGLYGSAGSQSAGAAQSLGSQAAGIAQGAGQYGAGVIGETAGDLANVYSQTGMQLGNEAVGAGGALGGNEADYWKGLGELDWNATTQGNEYTTSAAGVQAQTVGAGISQNQAGVPYAGGLAGAAGGAIGDAAELAAIYMMTQG